MSFWRGKSVLVVGAAGIAASWSDNKFLKNGARISALILDCNPSSQIMSNHDIENTSFVKDDLSNYKDFTRVMSTGECSATIRLTSQTIVVSALLDLLSTFEFIIKGNWNILEATTPIAGVKIG